MGGHITQISILLLALLSAPTLAVHCADSEKIVESHEDGSVKAKYTIDGEGRKQGFYVSYAPAGHVTVKATYRNDQLHGAYREFYKTGKIRYLMTYKEGMPNGSAYLANEKGKRIHSQRWKNGELVAFDEIKNPFSRSQDLLVKGAKKIRALPDTKPFGAWENAQLRGLMMYRHYANIPYQHLKLDATYNDEAAHCAEICNKLGKLTHSPKNPGWPMDKFKKADKGARSSNIANGAPDSINDMFINDSNASNIAHLGHRRWSLSPYMGKVGFGKFGRYSAMWAHDKSYAPTDDLIHPFPYSGWVPMSMMKSIQKGGPAPAWSISFNPNSFQVAPMLTVVIQKLDERMLPQGKPTHLSSAHVSQSNYGARPAIIFQPKNIKIEAGACYLVSVDGVDGPQCNNKVYRYLLKFFDDVLPAKGS